MLLLEALEGKLFPCFTQHLEAACILGLGPLPPHMESVTLGRVFLELPSLWSLLCRSLLYSWGPLWVQWDHSDSPGYFPCFKVIRLATLIPSSTLNHFPLPCNPISWQVLEIRMQISLRAGEALFFLLYHLDDSFSHMIKSICEETVFNINYLSTILAAWTRSTTILLGLLQ